MKRTGLFFTAFISAVITIISLNIAFGRPGYYNDRYPFYNHYHHCHNRYNEGYRDDKNHPNEKQQKADSLNSNY